MTRNQIEIMLLHYFYERDTETRMPVYDEKADIQEREWRHNTNSTPSTYKLVSRTIQGQRCDRVKLYTPYRYTPNLEHKTFIRARQSMLAYD